jgi:hypothetical protein
LNLKTGAGRSQRLDIVLCPTRLLLQDDYLIALTLVKTHLQYAQFSIRRHERLALVRKAEYDRRFVAGAHIVASVDSACIREGAP